MRCRRFSTEVVVETERGHKTWVVQNAFMNRWRADPHKVPLWARANGAISLSLVTFGTLFAGDGVQRIISAFVYNSQATVRDRSSGRAVGSIEIVVGLALLTWGVWMSRPRGAGLVFMIEHPERALDEWQRAAYSVVVRKSRHAFVVARPVDQRDEALRAMNDVVAASVAEGLSELKVFTNCKPDEALLLGQSLVRLPVKDLELHQSGEGNQLSYVFCQLSQLRREVNRKKAALMKRGLTTTSDPNVSLCTDLGAGWSVYRRIVKPDAEERVARLVLLLKASDAAIERRQDILGLGGTFLNQLDGGELVLVFSEDDHIGEGRPEGMAAGVAIAVACLTAASDPWRLPATTYFASSLPISASVAVGCLTRALPLRFVPGAQGAAPFYVTVD